MEDFYVKRGKKYVNIGLTGLKRHDELGQGIWAVVHNPYSTRITNVLYYLQGLPEPYRIEDMAKCMLLEDKIIDKLRELIDKDKVKIYNMSLAELAKEVIKELYTNMNKNGEKISS